MDDHAPAGSPRRTSGGAEASVRIGKAVALEASITPAGLLAVAALVSASLLGSAAIVLAARKRDSAHPTLRRLETDG